jgi:heat-inducible transcriptional repressor
MKPNSIPSGKPLKMRTGTVLKILVDEHISTAAPVASEDIARRSAIRVSPATIRNEMAELEEEGYIIRRHISSGGIPSDRGYRFYVESLEDTPEPPKPVQRHIRDQFGKVQRDMEVWIHLAATVLSRMADNMAIVTFPRSSSARLKHIQIVYLQEFLALLIIVLQETRLRQHLLPLRDPTSQDELSEIANKLNDTLAGLTYSEVQAKQMELTPFEEMVRADTSTILKEADTEAELDHWVDGLRLLLSQPEFVETRRAKEIVGILEERVLLRSILSEAPGEGNMGVYIGEENREEALRPFGVILSRYGIPQEASGTIGVIGPTRMEYPSVIGGVRFLSSFMSELTMGVHGRP